MDAQTARQLTFSTNASITSSAVWTFVMNKINSTAAAGGSYIIDPLQGYDQAVMLEEQSALYSELSNQGYTVRDTNEEISSGSFKGVPTKKIMWIVYY